MIFAPIGAKQSKISIDVIDVWEFVLRLMHCFRISSTVTLPLGPLSASRRGSAARRLGASRRVSLAPRAPTSLSPPCHRPFRNGHPAGSARPPEVIQIHPPRGHFRQLPGGGHGLLATGPGPPGPAHATRSDSIELGPGSAAAAAAMLNCNCKLVLYCRPVGWHCGTGTGTGPGSGRNLNLRPESGRGVAELD